MKKTWTKARRDYYMVVDYADGTFRVYEDDLAALKAYKPQRDESVRIVARVRHSSRSAEHTTPNALEN